MAGRVSGAALAGSWRLSRFRHLSSLIIDPHPQGKGKGRASGEQRTAWRIQRDVNADEEDEELVVGVLAEQEGDPTSAVLRLSEVRDYAQPRNENAGWREADELVCWLSSPMDGRGRGALDAWLRPALSACLCQMGVGSSALSPVRQSRSQPSGSKGSGQGFSFGAPRVQVSEPTWPRGWQTSDPRVHLHPSPPPSSSVQPKKTCCECSRLQ